MPPYSSFAEWTCPLEDRIRFFEPVASAIYHEQGREATAFWHELKDLDLPCSLFKQLTAWRNGRNT